MKKALIIYVLLFKFLNLACTVKTLTPTKESVNLQETKTPGDQTGELQKQIEQIASAAKGHVGVEAIVLETGEIVSFNPHDHFPMQSVYKFPIAMTVLQAVDNGKLKLDQKARVEKSDFVGQAQHSPLRDQNPNGADISVSELLRFAVSESDGTASDVLLRLAGGAQAVQVYLGELKVNEMIVLNTEKELGQDNETQYRNWASPDGAIALLRAIYEKRGLSEQSREFLLKLMTETPTGQKRLKGLLPTGTIVAHKTGTSGTKDGITAATNDIGMITLPNGNHLGIAVFVSDSPADEMTREEVIAKIAKAVCDKWSN